jgi:ribosomal-protein-alanine N-acetyltransferase
MAIERQVYPRPWSPNLFLSEMSESRNRCYLVARLDREVVGYGGLICYGEEAHVTNVAVDPLQHRRRIGSRILNDLIAAALDMGAEAISLEVRVTNWGAQRLYGRFGFRPVGVRKNYYQEINEDALIMWLDGMRTPEFRARVAEMLREAPEDVRPDGPA